MTPVTRLARALLSVVEGGRVNDPDDLAALRRIASGVDEPKPVDELVDQAPTVDFPDEAPAPVFLADAASVLVLYGEDDSAVDAGLDTVSMRERTLVEAIEFARAEARAQALAEVDELGEAEQSTKTTKPAAKKAAGTTKKG